MLAVILKHFIALQKKKNEPSTLRQMLTYISYYLPASQRLQYNVMASPWHFHGEI